MRFSNVAILGVAHIDAPNIVTTKSIEDRVNTYTQKMGLKPLALEAITGIKERKHFDLGTKPSDVATKAALKLLEKTQIDRSKIGVVVNTSVCKDYIEPSVAAFVHGNLELSDNCLNFDIGNACLAFMTGMEMIGNMIERGQVDYGLIVNGETAEIAVGRTLEKLENNEITVEEFRSYFATLTLGSGAVAMILTRKDLHPDCPEVIGSVSLAATQFNRLCVANIDEMKTDPKTLLIEGIKLASKTYEKAKRELNWDSKKFDQYLCHQVSKPNNYQFCEAIEIDINKVYKLFPEYGNIGPASIPVSLSKAVEEGVVKKGGRYALMGIGSGINTTMMEIEWS